MTSNIGAPGPVSTTASTTLRNAGGTYSTPFCSQNRVDQRYARINIVDADLLVQGPGSQLNKHLAHGVTGSVVLYWAHTIDTVKEGPAHPTSRQRRPQSYFPGDYRNERGARLSTSAIAWGSAAFASPRDA